MKTGAGWPKGRGGSRRPFRARLGRGFHPGLRRSGSTLGYIRAAASRLRVFAVLPGTNAMHDILERNFRKSPVSLNAGVHKTAMKMGASRRPERFGWVKSHRTNAPTPRPGLAVFWREPRAEARGYFPIAAPRLHDKCGLIELYSTPPYARRGFSEESPIFSVDRRWRATSSPRGNRMAAPLFVRGGWRRMR